MVGRTKEKINAINVLNSSNRRNIFLLCREQQNFTKLKELTKLSAGALFHHLKILEKLGIIKQKIAKEKGKRKRGNEIMIKSDEKKYHSLLKKESEKGWEKIKKNPHTKKILQFIKKINTEEKKVVTSQDLNYEFSNKPIDTALSKRFLESNYYIGYIVSKEGEEFLKKWN